MECSLIVKKVVERCVEVLLVVHLETTAQTKEVLCLAEILVVGTNQDGDTIHSSLRHIVDAHTKATTHIGYLAIAIDAAKETKAVDDETVHLGNVEGVVLLGFLLGIGIATEGTSQLGLYLLEMTLVDDMRCQD